MGHASSSARYQTGNVLIAADQPLVPQRHFEGTIHKRFVKTTTTTLEFPAQFWHMAVDGPVEIRDVTQNKLLFKVPPPKDDASSKRILCDAYGVPVVGLEHRVVEPAAAKCIEFSIVPGGYAGTNVQFRFETRDNAFDYPLMMVLAGEELSNDRVWIVGVGRHQWLARRFEFDIQRHGRTGQLWPIARQEPVGDLADGKYRIVVAPGVDLSLVVLLAAAMEITTCKYAGGFDRYNLKRESKRQAKAEKRALKAAARVKHKDGQEAIASA